MLSKSMELDFYQWISNKPQKKKYPYFNPACCCFAQFLYETGRSTGLPSVGGYGYVTSHSYIVQEIPPVIQTSVTPVLARRMFGRGYDTFGRAKKRFERAYMKAYGHRPPIVTAAAPQRKLSHRSADVELELA